MLSLTGYNKDIHSASHGLLNYC